jgi:nucleoside-diphosphate-sugar epimerase
MILVTGGTGLVGSHLLFDLVKSGQKVRALKRKSSSLQQVERIFSLNSSNSENLLKNIEWFEADTTNILELEQSFDGITKVYHCAAFVSYNPKDKEKMFEINIEGTRNIVNICLEKKVEKLVYVSSIAALGAAIDDELITEETYWEATGKNSNYSISKYHSEMEVWRGIAEGLNAAIINPSIILAIGKTSSTSIFRLIQNGFKFYTNGFTGFVDVRDVSKSMILLMNSDVTAERFIISSENYSWKEIFDVIAQNLKKSKPTTYATKFMTEFAWRMSKLQSFLSFSEPTITKETARTSHKVLKYSNEKFKEKFNFEYIPVKESVEYICKNL